jgi:hypothetical protein
LPFKKSVFKGDYSILRFTGQTDMVSYNATVKNVNNRHDEKESVFPGNVAVFKIGFPELVGSRNDPIPGQPAGVFALYFPLRP